MGKYSTLCKTVMGLKKNDNASMIGRINTISHTMLIIAIEAGIEENICNNQAITMLSTIGSFFAVRTQGVLTCRITDVYRHIMNA